MRLTNNFSLIEFLESEFYTTQQQRDVYADFIKNMDEYLPRIQKLANNLQVLRDKIGKPISINIAFRPTWYELSKGRSGKSQHTLCKAADIHVKGVKTKYIHETIEDLIDKGEMLQGGLGYYPNFIHYDIRKAKARW